MKENKYNYLTEYQIKAIKKETKEEILKRVDNLERDKRRAHWDQMHYGNVKITTFKNGDKVNTLDLNEEDTNNGFSFSDLKSISIDIQKLYQDYESNIKTVIVLTDVWDEQ